MSKADRKIESELAAEMLRLHGPLIGGDALRQALGFPSADAFRQALHRNKLPIAVFALPYRRGKFALTQEVVRWLMHMREEGKTHRPPVPTRQDAKKPGR